LALWQNSDTRTRAKAFAVAGLTTSLMVLYPAFAIVKNELLPGPGHTSLIGTAAWQLAQRQGSGSVLHSGTSTHGLWLTWIQYDQFLIYAGAAAAVGALLIRRLRPLALAMAGFALALFTGGYVPFMQVINLMPFAALLLAGVLARAIRSGAARIALRPPAFVRLPSATLRPMLQVALSAAVVAALAVVTGPHWYRSDAAMAAPRAEPPLKQADRWVADNVPRDRVLVVHDALWTDLVAKDRFDRRNVVIVYKLDGDPAVHKQVTRIDYLVLPDYYYRTQAAQAQYPTAIRARDHAVAVAHFGSDPTSAVTIYRVSSRWSPAQR
jgi:hypothetical protein